MKNLLSALLLFSILFTVGCDDDDATATEDASLVGTWELTSASVVIHSTPEETVTFDVPNEVSITMVLAEDGSYAESGTYEGEISSFGGTWSATDTELTFVVEIDEDIETWLNNYTLSGDVITLVGEEEGDEEEEEDAETITLVYARQ